MGKYKGPLKISGSFKDITLCSDGTARNKSGLTKDKYKRSVKFAGSRDAATILGGASACAGAMFRKLPDEMRRFARSHAHNHIATGLRKETEGVVPDRFTFEMALPALHRLDLSRAKDLARTVTIRALGNPVQPKGIHMLGLRDAADAIALAHLKDQKSQPQTHLSPLTNRKARPGKQPLTENHPIQFRLHFAFVEFAKVFLAADEWRKEGSVSCRPQPASNWLSPEMVPEEGLALAIQTPNPLKAQVLFVGIEWRLMDQSHKPSKNLDWNDFSLLKIAALFRPEADLHLPIPSCLHSSGSRRYLPQMKNRQPRRPHFSPVLKTRLALPMLDVMHGETHYPSCIGFAPELLLRPRKPRQPTAAQDEVGTVSHPI